MLNKFLSNTIEALKNCIDVANIDKVLGESIPNIYEVVPEFALYKGKARESVEASMHTSSSTRKYYGIDLTMEEARAMLGAHCFLLFLAGTENAYKAFVRKQHLVPGRKPVLTFGNPEDTLEHHSFLGMHHFLIQTKAELQAAMFYAALINDLGKTDYVKELYRDHFKKDPEDNDETLGKVLKITKEFSAFNDFDKSSQALIVSCSNMPCTFSELQQIERPKQAAAKFLGIPKEELLFHFIMEYFGDVPGAMLPPPEADGTIIVACQTMHQETVQHIELLYKFFIQNYDPAKEFDFIAAYRDYTDARLRLVGIDPDQEDLKTILPIVKFAIGASRTGSKERGAQVLALVRELPESVKHILFREFDLFGLKQSIYMLNIVPLVMGPFYLIAPKIKEGMTIGLCLAAYLYEETRKAYPNNYYDEFKGNASQIADLFTTKVTPDIKDKILPLYESLKGIRDIEEVVGELEKSLERKIYAIPASNGVRFLSSELEKVEVKVETEMVKKESIAKTPYAGTLFAQKCLVQEDSKQSCNITP